ncbi:MAG: threonylcarbamoyl-AMP synthase [Prevotellaceae bacterium]|jgi:L-threonylcarbamoyladenylate synthase|nr:threonylcarbamoyl-AMP synthase [Prevotellaceae bacterium]
MTQIQPNNALLQEVQNAVTILKKGGIILYPTDTIWGLGCDATNAKAVDKIYKLKQRAESKSMLLLVDSLNRIGKYMREVPMLANDLVELAESPLTIIYSEAINLPDNLIAKDRSIGIRVCRHAFCQQLIYRLGCPIVSTSANISGMNHPKRLSEVSNEIAEQVDFTVNIKFEGHPTFRPSSVIKLGVKGEVEVIRD